MDPCSVGLPPRADSSSRTRQEPHATKTTLYIPMTPKMHRNADAPIIAPPPRPLFASKRHQKAGPAPVSPESVEPQKTALNPSFAAPFAKPLSLAAPSRGAIALAFARRPASAGLGLGTRLFHTVETFFPLCGKNDKSFSIAWINGPVFPQCGKYFSIAWKNREKVFHTVENFADDRPVRPTYAMNRGR